jgi:hypothetical protein
MQVPNLLTLKSIARSLGALLVSLWGVSGCYLVFGDFQADPSLGQGGAANKGGAAATGGGTASACSQAYQCTSAGLLQKCLSGKWSDVQLCPDPARCNAVAGQCDTCTENQLQCNGTKTIEICNGARNGWSFYASCDTTQNCDLATFNCAVCPAGKSCKDETTLITCSADQKRIVETTTCTLLDGKCHVVDGADDSCTQCAAGESYCTSDNIIWTCSDGLYVVTADCSASGCQTVNGQVSCKN